MKKSIFFKIFSGCLFISVSLSACILFFSFRIIRESYIETMTSALRSTGAAVSSRILPILEDGDFGKLTEITRQLGKAANVRITVIDRDGVVVSDSEADPAQMDNHANRPEFQSALRGETGSSMRYSATEKTDMLYVALPLSRDAKMPVVVRISIFVRDLDKLTAALQNRILAIALIITCLSIIGAFFLARSLSVPIRSLARFSRRVGDGDFEARIVLKREDELKELADSFNLMTVHIKQLIGELSEQKDELIAVVSSLKEGLAVLDGQGRIVLANKSFDIISGQTETTGRFYWEVLRSPGMTALLDHAREKRKTVTEEVEFSGRHLLCSTAFPGTSEEVVLIMHDITDIHEFEKTKHDFIVNASHELQTPLTAIKGFVETMEEEEQDETKRHYFEIIRRHTDRLVNIVRDLLLLSRLEEMDMNLEMEEINLQAMVGDMEKLFEVRLRDRGLRLVKNIPDSLPALRADRFKIEQMFINLIDNAIKYTDQGEITITAGLRGGSMVIEVADTGMGIAMEHIPRIFERFYVADRSHSKKAGGTGLGLSIVKHIVLLHNGSIDVESIRGKGTKFIIHLPL